MAAKYAGFAILSEPPGYARKYELYISPAELFFFMKDTLVERLVDLEAARPVAVSGPGRKVREGYAPRAAYRMGPWLLGRRTDQDWWSVHGPRTTWPSKSASMSELASVGKGGRPAGLKGP